MLKYFSLQKGVQFNIAIYSLFMIIAFLGIIYGISIKSNYSFLRVWEYRNILILLLGVPFLFLQSRVNLPNFLEINISNQQRFLTPALIGAVFGMLDVIVIKFLLHPEPYTELPPFLQPFPYSLFLYISGAFEIEVFYRLIPLSLILLAAKWIADGKYLTYFFWIAAVLTSLREPIEQWPDGEVPFIVYSLMTGFVMNFLQSIHYKKSGFLASLTIRLGHYLFWHILLGIYVQYCELL